MTARALKSGSHPAAPPQLDSRFSQFPTPPRLLSKDILEVRRASPYSTVVACHDLAGPRLPVAVADAPPAAVSFNRGRLLLFAVPLSAVLWAVIIFLALRLRAAF